MKPITIRVFKAKTVPAENTQYQFRTIWKTVYKITYHESENIFKRVGDINKGLGIETDAQFAKWLVDNFGNGRYHLYVWKRGISGWTFYNFNCIDKSRFFQIGKKKKFRETDKEQLLKEYQQKKKEIKNSENDNEKEQLKKELEEIKDDLEMEDEIIEEYKEEDKNIKKVKPFKNIQPVYSEHEYEDYGKNIKKELVYDDRLI